MQSRHSKLYCLCSRDIQNFIVCAVATFKTLLFVQSRHSKLYCLCSRDIQNFIVCAVATFKTLLFVQSRHSKLYCLCSRNIQNFIVCAVATFKTLLFVQSSHSKLISLRVPSGAPYIPAWLLKENADLFAEPVRDILNYSYREGHLPQSWKEADIIPVPKQKPIKDINKHLRPISLTPIISKVAEEYVVESCVKPAVLKRIDSNQSGTIPNSSTTHALISMLHTWNKHTDGNGSTVRVVMFDFK